MLKVGIFPGKKSTMITAIVTSDNHLGTYYARLRPDRLEQRRLALQHAFERVVDAAIEQNVDLFLHAGDLFDRPDPRNAERAFVARQMRRLREANIPAFAIAGNHDSPHRVPSPASQAASHGTGVLPQEELDVLGGLHLFGSIDSFTSHTLTIRGEKVAVWGLSSDFNRAGESCPLDDYVLPEKREGDYDLYLLHYGVEGWTHPLTREPRLSLANLDRLPASAICVGHLHARAERRLPGGAVLINPGATEHIHFGEEKLECGYWLLHMERGHVETRYVPLPVQPMQTITLEVENAPSDLMSFLVGSIEAVSQPALLLRVRLSGQVSREQFQELDLAALQARGAQLNFHCQLDTEQLTVVDDLAELPLGYGVSFDAAEELQRTAQAVAESYGDDAGEQEVCRLAGREINATYELLTGAAR